MAGHEEKCECMKCEMMHGYIAMGDLNLEEAKIGQYAEEESFMLNMDFLRL